MKTTAQIAVRDIRLTAQENASLTNNHDPLVTDGDTRSITLRPSVTAVGGEPDQIDCVKRLPEGSQTIIVDPPDGLPVDSMSPTSPEIEVKH